MIMAAPAVVETRTSELDEAFPKIEPGIEPCGSRILIQIGIPKKVTQGGIILPSDTRDTISDNTQIAKVIAVGPLAFKNRNTMETWSEGQWVKPGDFIRAPKYGGDRWEAPVPGGARGDVVTFVIIDDLNVIGKVTGDPLSFRAHI